MQPLDSLRRKLAHPSPSSVRRPRLPESEDAVTIRTPDKFAVVIGYGHPSEFMKINSILSGSVATVIGMGPDLQAVIDAIAEQRSEGIPEDTGLVVLLNPDTREFSPDFIQHLLFDDEGPIPVIGFSANDTGNAAPSMKKAGATHFFELSKMTEASKLVAMLAASYRQVVSDREAGKHHLIPDIPIAPVGSIMSQCICAYLPKGGASSRTTTIVNLGAALAALGNPTCIVDFDPTKGDVHTYLGFTTDHTSRLTPRFPLVDRSLFDLITSLARNWKSGDSLPMPKIDNYRFLWEGHASVGNNLHFLPGLLSPASAGSEDWQSRPKLIFEIARAIIRALKTRYLFVLVDIGQDYNQPLVAAALSEASEILVPIPPNNAAIRDVQLALPTMVRELGSDELLRWFPAIWSDEVGAAKPGTISKALGIPQLNVTIPCDHSVADRAVNEGVPFVLWDEGPLGTN